MKVSYDYDKTLIRLNHEELMLLNGVLNFISFSEDKGIHTDELQLTRNLNKELQPAVDRLYESANENYNQEIKYINGVYNK